MRRKPEPRTARPRRRSDADIPPVPTVRPDAESTPAQHPHPPVNNEDPTEEAVRRMVEAAYT
jgi:hypothetical protein